MYVYFSVSLSMVLEVRAWTLVLFLSCCAANRDSQWLSVSLFIFSSSEWLFSPLLDLFVFETTGSREFRIKCQWVTTRCRFHQELLFIIQWSTLETWVSRSRHGPESFRLGGNYSLNILNSSISSLSCDYERSLCLSFLVIVCITIGISYND